MIKKRIFRFWMVNILMSIALFIIYRMVIAESKPVDESWIEKLLYMLDILLNLGFSIIFLLVMLVGSLAIFLNQIEKIRNNYYVSLLTFLATPLVSTIGLLIKLWIDFHTYDRSIMKTVAVFSILYLLLNTATFSIFRKRVGK
ncbi:hypothetical protein [Pedobacter sp.]|uniref:hypothetical protein n=1 Tax=Pedobacter sp. TaxID=1411316 RepID=UPI0031DEFE4F